MTLLTGISANGKLGKEPKISFATPKTVNNNTYAIVQQGDGAAVADGDRVCTQGIAISATDGSQLANTWTKNTPDCSMRISKSSMSTGYYQLFKGKKLNTTIAFGVNDASSSTSSSASTSYVMVLTLVSKTKPLTRATGAEVTDIPANLPKVTLDKTGKPSLDLNGYKPSDKLVVQPLIAGTGKTVKETDTVSANYTGWTLDAKGKLTQFDSSWDRGEASDFSLSQVIAGWTKGLTGQKVGSQVLLVVPPSEGYGNKAQSKIPANSTLYFVVDILYAG
jgi:peptidylprolyl isomerase